MKRGADFIGPARCPVCESPDARASLMATGRVCITCNGCKVQVFARGDVSDAKMRERIAGAKTAAELEGTPAPVLDEPAPEPEPKRKSWGIF